MNKILIFCFVLFVSCDASHCHGSELQKSEKKAIEICKDELLLKNQSQLIRESNRVYIHRSTNLMGLIFVRGALGSFQKRDKDYKPLFICDVGFDFKITYLAKPRKDPMIGTNDQNKTDIYENEVIETLYFLDNNLLPSFVNSQILDEKNLEKYN